MNICFLYPGQGAQYPGMGKELYESRSSVKQLFEMASDMCGIDTRRLLFDADEHELKETRNTQIAVTLMNLTVRSCLLQEGIESAGCAGFSLGEWSALADAGTISERDLLPVVMKRAEMMTEAADSLKIPGGSGMAAVVGLASEEVEKTVEGIEGVYPANYNAPDQTVISGTSRGVEAGAEACKAAGARRVVPLKVSGPFHTPLMDAAARAFESYLEDRDLGGPVKHLYSNATGGEVRSVDEVRRNASLQINSPVRWTSEEEIIAGQAYDLCIECGPGRVLTGLWKRSGAEVPCLPAGTWKEIDTVMQKISEMDR